VIIIVPIERLEERYSDQWYRWFKAECLRQGKSAIFVGDTDKRSIKEGQFLDVYDTNIYKAGQLKSICELIKNAQEEVTVFFMDLWFPGIEALAYIRDITGKKITIKGIFHAGTYDPWDFLAQKGCERWGKDIEEGWMKLIDEIFVGTYFHKTLLGRRKRYSNITVTGLPVYVPAPPDPRRGEIVVFPHRLAPEKRPEQFDEIMQLYYRKYKDTPVFVKSKEVCFSKGEYYQLLKKSKVAVSTAEQETFGIAMLEALNCGCLPVVPDRLAYRDTFLDYRRYTSIPEAVDMIHEALVNYKKPPLKYPYEQVVREIVERI